MSDDGFPRCAPASAAAIALLCATFASGLAAHVARAGEPDATSSDGWHEGAPPDGSFHVRGPARFEALVKGKPADVARDPTAVQGVVATQAGAFGSVVKYVARCVPQPDDRRAERERIEEAVAFWKGQAPLRYQRDVRVGSLAGVEFEIADPQKLLRVRVLPAPQRICTLFVQWDRAGTPREEKIARFLDSFELRKR